MYCYNCGKNLNPGENFCGNCGSKIENINDINQAQNLNNQKDDKALVGLILGIVSLILSFFLNVLVVPLSIIGLIFGLISKKKGGIKTLGILINIFVILILIFMFVGVMVYEFDVNSIDEETNLNSNETTVENEELNDIMNAMSNWNRYSELREGKLGKKLNITGGWRILEDSESYWEFKNNKFWWYKSVNDLNDNYWNGTTEIVTGKKGFRLAGLDESKVDDVIARSNGKITEKDIYTMILTPTKIISGGEDKSSTNIPEGTTWTYIWILVDHGNEGIEAQVLDVQNAYTSYYVKLKD